MATLTAISFWIVLVLFICFPLEKVNGIKCYSCYGSDCIVKPPPDSTIDCDARNCSTVTFRGVDSVKIDIIVRGCANPNDKETEMYCTAIGSGDGRKEKCTRICAQDLCNNEDRTYVSTTQNPQSTTTPIPWECYECVSIEDSEPQPNCKVVDARTKRRFCPRTGACKTFVEIIVKTMELKSMTRNCVVNYTKEMESKCEPPSDHLYCSTYCQGHVCNHDDWDHLPFKSSHVSSGEQLTPSLSVILTSVPLVFGFHFFKSNYING